jgi:DNA-binding MarR family transcriptional regulator
MSPAGRSNPNEAARRHILELLDGAKERHERAFPDSSGDELHYFAHLSAIRQLTEIFYHRLLKPYQISHSEYRVLSTLRVRGREFRATPLDLNRVTQITSAGMTRTLDRLEEAGHVDRSPNPSDRRSVLVGLTPKGWDFAETLSRDLSAHYAEALADVGAKDLKAETETLRLVVERLADAVTR